ncbi:hypothetical protein ACLK1Z_01465 [Escherichia coli]
MLSRSDLLTLLTINFIVVTKGAERISEGFCPLYPGRDARQTDGD